MRSRASFTPAQADREAAVRLVFGVALCAALFVLFIVGLAFAVGGGRPAPERVLGGAVMIVAIAGIVQLLRWARGSTWTYDRPKAGLAVSETVLLGFASVMLFGFLVEPLGIWALLAFVAPVVPIVRSRFGLSTAEAIAVGAGLFVAILGCAAYVLG